MTIYQVLDERNHLVYEDLSFNNAWQEAEILNHSFDERFFFVEEAVVETKN